jgi:hypothetical protein
MNRFVLLRPGLVLVAALSLGLAGCGEGIGPGLTAPSTDASFSDAAGDGTEQTLEEITAIPTAEPTEELTQEPTEEPTATGPGLITATLVGPLVLPSPEDCVSYNPANLTVTASGDAWLLRDGAHAIKVFDTAADAEDGLRVARNWRKLCYIGRPNTGPDRYRHIINYFKEPSGLAPGLAPATIDCIPYDPSTLALYQGPEHPADPDNFYWMLRAGATPLLELHNQADALRAKIVASGYTRVCFIGAGNSRPDPYRYQMEWWRP